MPQTFDSKTPVVPNIQDAFLNLARRDRLVVRVRLMDGTEFEARIKNFDRFAVVVEQDGADHLLFKHAIATIRVPRSQTTYLTSHQN
jgi:host factor-I protein